MGITKRADENSIYVVKADGSTFSIGNKNLFSFYSDKGNPEAGDTIVVPIDSAYKDDIPY